MNPVQWIALAGATLILLAFALQQWGRWKATDRAYLWSNLVGAGLLTVVAWIESQWGFLLLEAVWSAVSVWGLYRVMRGA